MKILFDLAQLLPDLPSAEDACAERLAGSLRRREGIRRVHLTEEGGARTLCVHYAGPEVSRARIIEIAETLAAQLARSIGHARWDVGEALGAPRFREAVELLQDQRGVLDAYAEAAAGAAAAAATNTARYLCAEYLRDRTGFSTLHEALRKAGLEARALVATPGDATAPSDAPTGDASHGDPSQDAPRP